MGLSILPAVPIFLRAMEKLEEPCIKGLLQKAADPYLALLAYRATPLQRG